MEMKTISTFIILVLAVALPFILLHLWNRSKERRIIRELSGMSGHKRIDFLNHDHWRNSYAIATDKDTDNIYYLNRKKGQRYLIGIKDVETARVVTTSRSVKTESGMNNVVEKLALVLTFRNKEIPERELEFYDGEEFMTVDGEIPLVEKWEEIINSAVRPKKRA